MAITRIGSPTPDLLKLFTRVTFPLMKLTMAIVVYLLMGLVIGSGIYGIMHGTYWLLIASLIAYLLAFSWMGCLHH